MNIRRADKSLLPQMKALWQLCFGDSETYIEQYYDRFGTENSIVIERDGFLCAMGSCIPVDYVQPDGDVQRGAYLYAVCTHPDFRERTAASTSALLPQAIWRQTAAIFCFCVRASLRL